MLQTIHCPRNLSQLGHLLPKSKYNPEPKEKTFESVAKAYQNIKFDMANGSLTKTGLDNILTWADSVIGSKLQAILSRFKI